jgi:polysaccharide export outer membrane protein
VATKHFLLLAVMIAVCGTLQTGCVSKDDRPAPGPGRTGVSAGAGRQSEPYKIQPGDLLIVAFAGEPDFNQQVRVDWNGHISLPYVTKGSPVDIVAAGLSVSTLAARITDYATENKMVVNPRVQVLVAEYASQTFVVLGQVSLPGRYPFPRGVAPTLDLEEGIALAGGYTRLARQSLVLVKRGSVVHKVNLQRLATHSGEPHFFIVPGDIITVTERIF